MALDFSPGITNTHTYIGSTNKGTANANQYLYKGAGHMVYQSAWEPQRVNNFEVIIEGLDELKLASGTVHKPPSAAERLMLSVDSFQAPKIEIGRITTHYANNSIKWAGKPEFPDSSLVINDYIGVETEKILSAWFRCAYDFDSEKIGWATNYKKTAFLIEYAPDGSYARAWRLDGCWLASMELGDWNQQGNEQRKLNATLVYDRAVPDYGLTIDNSYIASNPNGTTTSTTGTNGVNSSQVNTNREQDRYHAIRNANSNN